MAGDKTRRDDASKHGSSPESSSGFYHYDLENNVLPKLEMLQQFGFYAGSEGNENDPESCGAHSPKAAPVELATRG